MRFIKIMIFFICLIYIGILNSDIPPGYYDGTEGLTGDSLKTALSSIISGHIEFSYDALRDYILPDTDEDPNNPDNVILIYTGWSRAKDDFGGNPSDWNREHVWAKSHGDFGNIPPAGTDAHHIRPCDVTVNSARGNLDFDNGGTEYIDGDGPTGCFHDEDSWEPREEVKGDVARMIFYMEVRYEGEEDEPDLEMVDYIPSSPNGEPYHALKSTLLEWHQQDSVDDWEILRNDKVYYYQENRNPFIDHPEFVGLIWGGVSVEDENLIITNYQLSNYPNPFNSETTIVFTIEGQETRDKEQEIELSIYNIKGQKIKTLYPFPNSYFSGGTRSVLWDGKDDNNKAVNTGVYFYYLKVNGINIVGKKFLLLK
ncbi:MAG: endonuclease [Candidatus Cloacimonetes bacterium]|nr:endonuclease [Candidatus Cloacimonadota bacterium]